MNVFTTTVIPTIARPTLARAVNSVLEQSIPEDFEVVVVNDSGSPLPSEEWQACERVHVLNTNRRERVVARNAGAAVSRGRYLHFLDDDDYLIPGALKGIWDLAQRSSADWLYGGSQLVDRDGKPLLQLHHEMGGNRFVQVMSGEWIPLQSSLIRADAFFAVGGFSHGVMVSQDVDLCRKILLNGEVAGTRSVMAVIGMGSEGSTTDYDNAFIYSRWAREQILVQPGVWRRLHGSADKAYWKGRIARLYLTSVLWNLQHRRIFTALSRAVHGMAAVAIAGTALLEGEYWKALAGPYKSMTFQKGQRGDVQGEVFEPSMRG